MPVLRTPLAVTPHCSALRSHGDSRMKFSIYRYDPDKDSQPRMQDYDVELQPSDRMLLDALIRIKAVDDSLSLRRSCREGVCGSDAMNINGKNGLACITRLSRLEEAGGTAPAAGIAGDSRPDRGHVAVLQAVPLGEALSGQQPARAGKGKDGSRLPSARNSTDCTSASCARAVRPLVPRSGGIPDKFVGPAGLLQAYRFLADSRDEATSERLDNLEDPYRLFRCHSIMNCVDVCPKGLNPTRAIGKIKDLMVKRAV